MKQEELDCQEEAADIANCLYVDRVIQASPIESLLARGDQARRNCELERAREEYWQVLQLANTTDFLEGLTSSLMGLAYMYLGTIYHAQRDFLVAINFYNLAREAFKLDRRNWAVTQFALGLAHARRGEQNKAYEGMAEALGILERSEVGGIAKNKWEKTRKFMEERFVKQEANIITPAEEEQTDNHQPKTPTAIRDPLPSPSEPAPPGTQSLVVLAIIALATVVAGAVFVFAVGQIKGLVSYVITLIVAIPIMAFLFSRLRMSYLVPFDCAVVLERMGTPIVMWGPGTVDKWPFIDQVRAIVPLCSLQYTCPKQKVFTKPDEAIEIRLVVSYGVNSKDRNSENVLKAVYHTQEGTIAKDAGQADSKGKSATRTINDLKQAWEKRLFSDIVMTLNEVLPGKNFGGSSSEQDRGKVEIGNELRDSLAKRAEGWGMGIEEISVTELSKPKA